jgi:hypothetical protein
VHLFNADASAMAISAVPGDYSHAVLFGLKTVRGAFLRTMFIISRNSKMRPDSMHPLTINIMFGYHMKLKPPSKAGTTRCAINDVWFLGLFHQPL